MPNIFLKNSVNYLLLPFYFLWWQTFPRSHLPHIKAFSFSSYCGSIAGLPVMAMGRMRASVSASSTWLMQYLCGTPFCISENERKKYKGGLEINLIEKVPYTADEMTQKPWGVLPLPRIIFSLVRSQITHLNTGGTSGCPEVGCWERLQWDTGNNSDVWCFGHTGHFTGICVYQNSSNCVQLIMLIDELYLNKDVRKKGGGRTKNAASISRQGKRTLALIVCCAGLSCSVVFNSFWPHEL